MAIFTLDNFYFLRVSKYIYKTTTNLYYSLIKPVMFMHKQPTAMSTEIAKFISHSTNCQITSFTHRKMYHKKNFLIIKMHTTFGAL